MPLGKTRQILLFHQCNLPWDSLVSRPLASTFKPSLANELCNLKLHGGWFLTITYIGVSHLTMINVCTSYMLAATETLKHSMSSFSKLNYQKCLFPISIVNGNSYSFNSHSQLNSAHGHSDLQNKTNYLKLQWVAGPSKQTSIQQY